MSQVSVISCVDVEFKEASLLGASTNYRAHCAWPRK